MENTVPVEQKVHNDSELESKTLARIATGIERLVDLAEKGDDSLEVVFSSLEDR